MTGCGAVLTGLGGATDLGAGRADWTVVVGNCPSVCAETYGPETASRERIEKTDVFMKQ